MIDAETYQALVHEVCELVRRGGRRGRIPLSPEVAAMLKTIGAAPPSPPSAKSRDAGAVPAPAPSPAPTPLEAPPSDMDLPHPDDHAGLLAYIEREVKVCEKCPLHQSRRNTVFGTGDPNARIVFVGEAPGEDEDRQGKPFVGRAGELLTRIIEGGMKIPRESVYICNVLKCRPPGNRDPNPEEVYYCEPYLTRQLEALRPKVICALGRHAAMALLKVPESTTVGRMRGKWYDYHGIPVRVTYHPSYILRCEDDPVRLKQEKQKVWDDVLKVKAKAEEEPSAARAPE